MEKEPQIYKEVRGVLDSLPQSLFESLDYPRLSEWKRLFIENYLNTGEEDRKTTNGLVDTIVRAHTQGTSNLIVFLHPLDEFQKLSIERSSQRICALHEFLNNLQGMPNQETIDFFCNDYVSAKVIYLATFEANSELQKKAPQTP